MTKNPLVAAISNFILPGLGYIYLKKRLNFGIILLISQILIYLSVYVFPLAEIPPLDTGSYLAALSLLLFHLAFAYDAYNEAKRSR